MGSPPVEILCFLELSLTGSSVALDFSRSAHFQAQSSNLGLLLFVSG